MRHRVPAGRQPQGLDFAGPGREPESFLMTTGCARPLEDAWRIAHGERVRGTSAGCGLDEINADMLLSHAGRTRLGNMVDPSYHGSVDHKKISGFMMHRQQRGGVLQ